MGSTKYKFWDKKLLLVNVLTAGITLLTTYLATYWFPHYGLCLFLGTPFLFGFSRVLLAARIIPDLDEHMFQGMFIPFLITYIGLFSTGVEGLICLAMILPLLLPISLFGWVVGKGLALLIKNKLLVIFIAYIALGGLHLYERSIDNQPPLRAVTTEIVITAPPEEVWNQVVSFSDIPAPEELLFRAGIAYPTHATISGTGPGAIRRCEFSTGTFVEPITIWDEPTLLRFSVTENPIPMKELSPYSDLSPAHLHGTFYSEQGEFRLERQEDGTTILYGTT